MVDLSIVVHEHLNQQEKYLGVQDLVDIGRLSKISSNLQRNLSPQCDQGSWEVGWRPVGSRTERIREWLVGGFPGTWLDYFSIYWE